MGRVLFHFSTTTEWKSNETVLRELFPNYVDISKKSSDEFFNEAKRILNLDRTITAYKIEESLNKIKELRELVNKYTTLYYIQSLHISDYLILLNKDIIPSNNYKLKATTKKLKCSLINILSNIEQINDHFREKRIINGYNTLPALEEELGKAYNEIKKMQFMKYLLKTEEKRILKHINLIESRYYK